MLKGSWCVSCNQWCPLECTERVQGLHKTARQDKGHGNELAEFIRRIEQGGEPLIPFEQLRNVTQASFAAVKSAHERVCIQV
ncbi:MAG: hypothetical protein RBR19_01715 [Sedimentisphaerales bacterium]|jgi:predicted dehydrogenase|nr:hypothetical protein [Sedimentisphaerales bacterium]